MGFMYSLKFLSLKLCHRSACRADGSFRKIYVALLTLEKYKKKRG